MLYSGPSPGWSAAVSFVLGAKLRELRVERGQSLQQVADAVSASKAHLWEVETGQTQNQSVDLVRRLADQFGVTVGWLEIGRASWRERVRRYVSSSECAVSLTK